AVLKGLIRLSFERFLAIFYADVEVDPLVRPRTMDPIISAQERDVRIGDRLPGSAPETQRNLEEVERLLRNSASLEDIPRDAALADRISRVGQADSADRCAGGNARNAADCRIGDGVERHLHSADREVIEDNLGEAGRAVLIISVVTDPWGDVAARSANHTPGL